MRSVDGMRICYTVHNRPRAKIIYCSSATSLAATCSSMQSLQRNHHVLRGRVMLQDVR